MEKLILLIGKQRTGKTTTLKMLTALLLPCCKILKSPRTKRTVDSLWKEIDNEMNAQKYDTKNFGIVLELKGKRIGIHTIGDSVPDVKGTIQFFNSNSCDVIIAPCHPDMAHIQMFHSAYGDKIHAIPKSKSVTMQEQYLDNISAANELFQLLLKSI